MGRSIAFGQSAGGQLALWAASRGKLPSESAVWVANPLPLRAVVSIGGVPDMRAFATGPGDPCGGRQVRVLGGLPAEHPERYGLVSPAERLPLGVPQVLIWGERDTVAAHVLFTAYEDRAKSAGDPVTSVTVPGAGHHDLMAPGSAGYGVLVEQLRRLLR